MDKAYAGLAAQQVAPPMPQIMDQVDQLARYQDELDELLDRMESRLNAIMHGGVPAQEGKQQAQISLALVPLAETIHGKVIAVQRANARIRDMLDRIEL